MMWRDGCGRNIQKSSAGEKTQVIHTDKSGEVSKKELDEARKAVHEVD